MSCDMSNGNIRSYYPVAVDQTSRRRSQSPIPYPYIKRILVYQSSWYLFAVMLILTISMHWQNILINNMTLFFIFYLLKILIG
ncbi:hypothetical protein RMATCC62417_05732 [Rhizopus microsporus]|nr:hypothetical protein RMATCC62417_05732 [Rhizopus microsporus]